MEQNILPTQEEKNQAAKQMLSETGEKTTFSRTHVDPPDEMRRTSVVNQNTSFKKVTSKDHMEMGATPGAGWYDLPVTDLPTKGVFLPEGTKIHIRAAAQDTLLIWSGMTNEDYDFFKREDIINQMVEKNCRVFCPGRQASARDLSEVADRIYLLFAIRELTFPDNPMFIDVECNECGNNHKIQIDKTLIQDYTIPENIMKWYNQTERCFTINATKPEVIEMNVFMPSIGVNNWAKNYFQKRHREQKSINDHIVKLLAFIVPDYKRLDDKFVQRIERDMKMWSIVKLSVLSKFADELLESYDGNIKFNCEACGSEVNKGIVFENGIKDLFMDTNILASLE